MMGRLAGPVVLLPVCVPTGAARAQQPAIRAAVADACLTQGRGTACIGLAAWDCIARSGPSTPVVALCLSQEASCRDDRLDISRDAAVAAGDAIGDKSVWAELYGKMQHAWIDDRDARRGLVAFEWGEGTVHNGAFMECALQVTAEQALYLEYGLDGAGR